MESVDSTVSSLPKVWTRILSSERSNVSQPMRGLNPDHYYLGISAPAPLLETDTEFETGEVRLGLRGRGTLGWGGHGNESDLPMLNFSPCVLSRRLSRDLSPRLTRSSILFSL